MFFVKLLSYFHFFYFFIFQCGRIRFIVFLLVFNYIIERVYKLHHWGVGIYCFWKWTSKCWPGCEDTKTTSSTPAFGPFLLILSLFCCCGLKSQLYIGSNVYFLIKYCLHLKAFFGLSYGHINNAFDTECFIVCGFFTGLIFLYFLQNF